MQSALSPKAPLRAHSCFLVASTDTDPVAELCDLIRAGPAPGSTVDKISGCRVKNKLLTSRGPSTYKMKI